MVGSVTTIAYAKVSACNDSLMAITTLHVSSDFCRHCLVYRIPRGQGTVVLPSAAERGQREVVWIVGSAAHRKDGAKVSVPNTPRLGNTQNVPGHREPYTSRVSD